jgi:hypothetical protein
MKADMGDHEGIANKPLPSQKETEGARKSREV